MEVVIDPARGNPAVPAGTAAVPTAKATRASAGPSAAAHVPVDGRSTFRAAALPPDATVEIEHLRPPLNAIMAQLGGQALLGARLVRGISPADLPSALSRGLVKPDAGMRATANAVQQLFNGVDKKS